MSDDLSPVSDFTREKQVQQCLRNGKILRGPHVVKSVLICRIMKMHVDSNDFGQSNYHYIKLCRFLNCSQKWCVDKSLPLLIFRKSLERDVEVIYHLPYTVYSLLLYGS